MGTTDSNILAFTGDLLDKVMIDVSTVPGRDPAPESCPTSPEHHPVPGKARAPE